MKTVTAGAHGVNNVVVDGSEIVKFSFASTCLAMEVLEGEVTVALTDTAVAGDDDTRTISEGTSGTFPHQRMGVDTYYLTGTGKVNLWASNKEDTNPFKAGKRGGDGGGTLGLEEVVLWENEGTTNPQTVTLSGAWSNFDELAIITDYIYQGVHYYNTNIKLTSTFIVGEVASFWYYDNSVLADYTVASSTTFTFAFDGGDHFLYKIIGRRYTRVNPTGYRQTVLWENEGTTSPDTITLSEAWNNFDELAIFTTSTRSVKAQSESTWHTSIMAIGGAYILWYNSDTVWGSYYATSNTVFTKITSGGEYYISKIIGIKY